MTIPTAYAVCYRCKRRLALWMFRTKAKNGNANGACRECEKRKEPRR